MVAEVKRLTGGGADVAIESLGTQQTFENALRCCGPAARCRALASIRASCKSPMTPSLPDSAITASLRRYVQAAKRGCAG